MLHILHSSKIPCSQNFIAHAETSRLTARLNLSTLASTVFAYPTSTTRRPLTLTLGAFDPVASLGILADVQTFSTLHCEGLAVPTGMLLADSAKVHELVALDAAILADSANLLLEDMPVAALKIGLPASPQNLHVLAELVSDYQHLPLVLDPFCGSLPESGSASDDIIIGMRDLLIPQATILQISAQQLAFLAQTWRDTPADASNPASADDAMWLIHHGCEYVLVTNDNAEYADNAPPNSICNTLYGIDGRVRQDFWPRLSGAFMGAGACQAAAICALLAHGIALPFAVLQAQLYCAHALAHAQRPGMGKLLPARHLLPIGMFELSTELTLEMSSRPDQVLAETN